MTKRKIISVFLITVVILGVCLLMAGCTAKERKYDVSMKIVCREVVNGKLTGPILGEWIFTPDIDEMHIEREYDGKKYDYYISQYNIPNHPLWDKKWFSIEKPSILRSVPRISFSGALWYTSYALGDSGIPQYVCERGSYSLKLRVTSTSNSVYGRNIQMNITVK